MLARLHSQRLREGDLRILKARIGVCRVILKLREWNRRSVTGQWDICTAELAGYCSKTVMPVAEDKSTQTILPTGDSMRRVTQDILLFAALVFLALGPVKADGQTSPPPPAAGQRQTPAVNRPGAATANMRYNADFFADKEPKTAFDMVNLLPGFTFSIGDNTIRGYAAAAGNVLIDGERVSDKQFTLDTVLQHIPADRVDYIEVIAGTRPDLEMLGQTVVANVVRKKSTGNSTIVTLLDGFFLDGRNAPSGTVEVTRRGGKGQAFSGAASAAQYVELAEGNGPQIRHDKEGNLLDRVSVRSAAGGLSAYTYGVFTAPRWKGKLSLNGSVARTDYAYRELDDTTYQKGNAVFPVPATSSLHEYLGGPLGGQLVSEVGGHFDRSFGKKITSESVALVDFTTQTYSSNLVSPGADERFVDKERVGEVLLRTNLRDAATPNLTAEFSAEGAYNWLTTTSAFLYNSAPIPLPNAVATVSEIRDQVLGHITWSVRPSLELDLGLQVEDSKIASEADTRQSKTLHYLKPRFTLTFKPNSANNLRFRVEHEVGQLDFSDFVASSSLDTGSIRSGNTNIVPQQDWAFESVYERHFWGEGDIMLTYRHLLIEDAIDRVPVYTTSGPASVFDAPGNIGAGSEEAAIASVTVPTDRFAIKHGQLKLVATRLWTSVTDPTTGAIRPISGINQFEYSVSFRQDLSRWHADWGAAFVTPCFTSSTVKGCSESQYRFDEVDNYRALPTINAFAEYQPRKRLSFRIETDNLLRQRYNRVVNIYAGPRNAFPLSYQDDRSLTSAASVLFSLRKTF